jgi:hypothetical protein
VLKHPKRDSNKGTKKGENVAFNLTCRNNDLLLGLVIDIRIDNLAGDIDDSALVILWS